MTDPALLDLAHDIDARCRLHGRFTLRSGATSTYGTGRLAEGGEFAGATVTLIEDVITTGGAVRAVLTEDLLDRSR
ncbi:hypothetical protein [Nocardia jiangsuensis]|uniref:Orotate phosphoribosyltransferase n=1 Tax=Nocardia jiangsuensis TaxID=1691563 RepID=A0ABV8DYF8_9NOCA